MSTYRAVRDAATKAEAQLGTLKQMVRERVAAEKEDKQAPKQPRKPKDR